MNINISDTYTGLHCN